MKQKINGISLNYEITGQGDVLVLTHGLGGSMEGSLAHVPVLSEHYRVLAWDQRGCGQSDSADAYNLELVAEDLYHLLKALKIDKIHLLGTSWGGFVVQRFALEHPDMLKSLIICSSSSEVNEQSAKNYRNRADMVEREGVESLTSGLKTFVPAFAGHEDMRNIPSSTAEAYAGFNRAMANLHKDPITPNLLKITCPTLVLGAGKDATAGAAGSVIINRNISDSKLVIFPDSGHNIGQDKPDEYRAAILEFLATVK